MKIERRYLCAHFPEWSKQRDCRALYKLALQCLKFSPVVGIDHELFVAHAQGTLKDISPLHYGITIDLTGTQRLHGDIHRFALRMHNFFESSALIAIAPTFGAAWAFSRYSVSAAPRIITSEHDLEAALGPLPIAALRVPEKSIDLLNDIGVQNISALMRLPRHTIALRFGKVVTYRLDQALGQLEERLHTVEPPKRYNTSRIFEPPLTSRKSIVIAIYNLFQIVLRQLKANQRCAKYFHLALYDTADTFIYREFALAAATDDIKHLGSIIEPIIDQMNFSGEIREVIITARQIQVARPEQFTLSPYPSIDEPSCKEREELINIFSVRLGRDRLLLAHLNQSHIPERAFAYHSAADSLTQQKHTHSDIPKYSLNERPSYLLTKPEEIKTISMLPDRPPSFIQWRGKKFKILTGVGPERISPEWWEDSIAKDRDPSQRDLSKISSLLDNSSIARDYFKIQDECGRWLWVFRDQTTHNWFLHGMWI